MERLRLRQYDLPYEKHTRGIVTTAGGPYLPVAVVSIHMLRRTGSELPVEIFLASQDEWDSEICSTVLPALNAQCVVLQDIFQHADDNNVIAIEKYQYKVMSILLSSFEEVLFLDSDCFPVYDPEQLFETEPFTSTGMVLWPDFWAMSESPYFFDIARIDAPSITERASTESGQIMYSKAKHSLSIMLAAYYNYYGPDFYYPLQSQGAPGEGDKDTFPWAAAALNQSFYHVRTKVKALGYMTRDGQWRGSAMAQHDPVDEYRFTSKDGSVMEDANGPRPFFIHANFPKFDPSTIFQLAAMGGNGPTRDSDGTMRRVWTSDEQDATLRFGFDVERRLFDEIKTIACQRQNSFTAWYGRKDICKEATAYWDAMHGKAGP